MGSINLHVSVPIADWLPIDCRFILIPEFGQRQDGSFHTLKIFADPFLWMSCLTSGMFLIFRTMMHLGFLQLARLLPDGCLCLRICPDR